MITDLSPYGGKTETPYSKIWHDYSSGQVETAEKAESSENHSPQLIIKEGKSLLICKRAQ